LSEIPETRESLLVRLKDPDDRDAWDQFAQLYRGVIYRLARGRGLQDADAQDLVQQVLMAVAAAIPRWRRSGTEVRFRHWLRRVSKNAILNALSRRPRDAGGGGTTLTNLLREYPDPDGALEEAIDWEHRREVYRRAASIVRGEVSQESWQVFAMTVIDGQSAGLVAQQLNKSVGAVYVARCRTIARLREVAREIEEDM
jgi:RNA polymerase sigma-70 factor (ECF subfamily)